jgi:hypothetical protein
VEIGFPSEIQFPIPHFLFRIKLISQLWDPQRLLKDMKRTEKFQKDNEYDNN